MSKFKVGDRVKCVNNRTVEDELDIGKEYTVTYASCDGIAIRDGASYWDYYNERFGLAESEKELETFQYQGKIYRRATPEDSGKLGIMCDYDISDAATAANEPYVCSGTFEYRIGLSSPWRKEDTGSRWNFAYVEVDQKPAEPTVYERVTSRIERSTLIYNYLDAKDTFERAMAAYNEACQAIRNNVKDGEKFVYTRYGEGYIVSRDKDGFTVDKIDMV